MEILLDFAKTERDYTDERITGLPYGTIVLFCNP